MLTSGPTEDEARLVGEHFDYLQALVGAGVVEFAGRTTHDDTSSFGIVLFEAPDLATAEEVVAGDPAVRDRVFRAELFPFRVALRR